MLPYQTLKYWIILQEAWLYQIIVHTRAILRCIVGLFFFLYYKYPCDFHSVGVYVYKPENITSKYSVHVNVDFIEDLKENLLSEQLDMLRNTCFEAILQLTEKINNWCAESINSLLLVEVGISRE